MWLTDSQQIKLLQELSDTSAKLERVFKKYHLDTVPEDVIEIRKEVMARRKREHEIGAAAKQAINLFISKVLK